MYVVLSAFISEIVERCMLRWMMDRGRVSKTTRPLTWIIPEYAAIEDNPKIHHRFRLPWYTSGFE